MKRNPVFNSNLLGSARWASNEIWDVFKSTLNTPGLLFGTVGHKPLILPADVSGNLNVSVLGPPALANHAPLSAIISFRLLPVDGQ